MLIERDNRRNGHRARAWRSYRRHRRVGAVLLYACAAALLYGTVYMHFSRRGAYLSVIGLLTAWSGNGRQGREWRSRLVAQIAGGGAQKRRPLHSVTAGGR